ncbi:DUF4848 domain-containing protein [uncultured Bacteroides sp.]|uniref:DUF4848 domain-containing protein n=1 Tax=uncultured Bacteroides sp. TaxID=162156 RepID=UPI002592832B|nr:DUF4848 domain-containing protein [uncultured Bacteroides sp.]
MNQTKKMKFSNVITLGFLALGLFSCNNENEIMDNTTDSQLSEVEVSNLSEWNNETRSSNGIQDEKVLRFRDLDTYRKVLSKLSSMTDEEKTSYFQKIGFDGAFTLLQSANNEADLILDSDDLNYIEAKANEYKKKYSSILSFSPEDPYDLTPYLNFTDKELSIIGSTNGYVVIGNSLKEAENAHPTYDEYTVIMTDDIQGSRAGVPGPIQPGWREFKNASLTIKKGKYKSTMTIGRIVNGHSLAVSFQTKKKVVFWNKSVNTNYSVESLSFNSPQFNYSNKVVGPRSGICILGLLPERVGKHFDSTVKNFQSGKCGEARGNQTFKNITVM